MIKAEGILPCARKKNCGYFFISFMKSFQNRIASISGSQPDRVILKPVGGGSINKCFLVQTPSKKFFCKINDSKKFPSLFLKEKAGLLQLNELSSFSVPRVIDCFEQFDSQFLLMEYIEEGEKTDSFWKMFGEKLAMMHSVSAKFYGNTENNYMGSVKQDNTWMEDWTSFYREKRLKPLLQSCFQHNLLQSQHLDDFEKLFKKLRDVFEINKPSLLHGDLWSGNFMCSKENEPVLIDPAVYYGHPAMDLGMSTMFGGFNKIFYEAYNHHAPFPSNYHEQWEMAQLYPLLIHLLLFGKSYLGRIEQTIARFK